MVLSPTNWSRVKNRPLPRFRLFSLVDLLSPTRNKTHLGVFTLKLVGAFEAGIGPPDRGWVGGWLGVWAWFVWVCA